MICSPYALESEGIGDLLRETGCATPRLAATIEPGLDSGELTPLDVILLDGCHLGEAMRDLRDLAAHGRRVIVLVGPERDGSCIHEVVRADARGCLSCDEEPQRFAQCVQMVSQGAVVISSDAATRMAGAPVTAQPPLPSQGLTDRQHQIATTVAQGASNREIGEALNISEHTVKIQLGQAFEKLGLRNRQQLAAHIADQGMLEDVHLQ